MARQYGVHSPKAWQVAQPDVVHDEGVLQFFTRQVSVAWHCGNDEHVIVSVNVAVELI